MTHIPIVEIRFNNDDYPYDYQLEVWKDTDTCTFYIREELESPCPEHREPRCRTCSLEITGNFDQFFTVGQTLRWIHVGTGDREYGTGNIDFLSRKDNAMFRRTVLDMRWEELVDSGLELPASICVTFPNRKVLQD